jgi:hypothetical protein
MDQVLSALAELLRLSSLSAAVKHGWKNLFYLGVVCLGHKTNTPIFLALILKAS